MCSRKSAVIWDVVLVMRCLKSAWRLLIKCPWVSVNASSMCRTISEASIALKDGRAGEGECERMGVVLAEWTEWLVLSARDLYCCCKFFP